MTEDPLSVDYWIINYCIDKDYKEKPYYIKAHNYWSLKKSSLLDIYKDQSKVVEFINNITVIQFHEKDDCYTIIGVITPFNI